MFDTITLATLLIGLKFWTDIFSYTYIMHCYHVRRLKSNISSYPDEHDTS
jgi:hypothetical protein